MVENAHMAGWWPHLYEPLRQAGQSVADWFAPRSDAAALAESYEINVELPGVKPENVDVSVHDNTLTVRGEKQSSRQETGRTYFFSEREYGSFQRTFRLPPDADAEAIDATFADGLLTVKIGKVSTTKGSARKIAVRKSDA